MANIRTKYTNVCLCIVFAIVLLLSYSSYAADPTFYVDGATGRNNESCGTTSQPCKTIKYTINKVVDEDSIINIAAGSYAESLIINKKNISLVGSGRSNTSIIGENVSSTITVKGPSRFIIRGLTITGGIQGISGTSASVKCNNAIIQNNQTGIAVESNSSLDITNSQVASNVYNGITIAGNSTGIVDACQITGNGESGILVDSSSSSNIANSQISNNSHDGLFLGMSSTASMNNSIVTGNDIGIHVTSHSSAKLGGANEISFNRRDGLMIQLNSHAILQSGISPDKISSNQGSGIHMGGSSHLALINAIIDNNGEHGLHFHGQSFANFDSAPVISNNGGWGIICTDAKYTGSIPTLSNNSMGQIACSEPQFKCISIIQEYNGVVDVSCPDGYTAVTASCNRGTNFVIHGQIPPPVAGSWAYYLIPDTDQATGVHCEEPPLGSNQVQLRCCMTK